MMDKETKERVLAQRERILILLREANNKGVTNAILNEISFRYTAHLSELRSMGYKIEAEDLGKGLFNYVLAYEPIKIEKQKKAIELFWDLINETDGDFVSKKDLRQLLENNKLNVVRNWGCNL